MTTKETFVNHSDPSKPANRAFVFLAAVFAAMGRACCSAMTPAA